mmetsp:Transcript_20757/g.25173  ORF Transcript_20757/g.25173 Transcript_20757/m.25173 type:complete len:267 (+) Transcript_20757:168-968(+)
MDDLLGLLGPLNDLYKLRAGELLSAHHGDVHAARNLFFREMFAVKPVSVIDFVGDADKAGGENDDYQKDRNLRQCKDLGSLYRPRRRRRLRTGNDTANDTTKRNSNSETFLAKISQDLFCRIMGFCELSEVSAMCLVNRNFNQVMMSNEIWYTLCERYWILPVGGDRDGEQIAWRKTFRRFFKFMSTLCCPESSCISNKSGTDVVVPIVYGFPSRELVEAMRASRLILGDDHIIEGRSVWYCCSCKTNWTHWPYTHLPKELCVSCI